MGPDAGEKLLIRVPNTFRVVADTNCSDFCRHSAARASARCMTPSRGMHFHRGALRTTALFAVSHPETAECSIPSNVFECPHGCSLERTCACDLPLIRGTRRSLLTLGSCPEEERDNSR